MFSIQSFATGILAEILRRQPPSEARTRFAWQLAVGPALARVTSVQLDGGVVTVRCADPRWGPELVRAREVVLGRLQELLGSGAVVRLKIVGTE